MVFEPRTYKLQVKYEYEPEPPMMLVKKLLNTKCSLHYVKFNNSHDNLIATRLVPNTDQNPSYLLQNVNAKKNMIQPVISVVELLIA